jgi:oxygen-independent coproporphyrinogen-3 oxidase
LTDPLALYVHWPFCLAKCPYCDFNSHVREQIDQTRFANALRRELTTEAERLGRRRLTSIFFGGGTPSLMMPATVACLLDDAAMHFDIAADIEITLEANPTSVEAKRLDDFRAAGINRVSLGIQSLDDMALQRLGRQHSARDAIAALALTRDLFPRISFDLIYARPGQTLPAWRAELRSALSIAADHLSLYQLTIEPATKYYTLHRQGALLLPDNDTASRMYWATEEECSRIGLAPYEISNYARLGQESRHNLAYWRYLDYSGIGPGAHGRVTVDRTLRATRRHRVPEIWANRVEHDGHAMTSDDPITAVERAREALLMGLRLNEGIELARFSARTGQTLNQSVNTDVLHRAIEEEYLVLTSDRLFATREGRIRLDALLGRLVD